MPPRTPSSSTVLLPFLYPPHLFAQTSRTLSSRAVPKILPRALPPRHSQLPGNRRASSNTTTATAAGAPSSSTSETDPDPHPPSTPSSWTTPSASPTTTNHHHYETNPHNSLPANRLNPLPDDYRLPVFSDRTTLTMYAGPGGSGCISFLRDLHFGGDASGPPNGGDGGHGGNIYIAAAYGETSLHKLGRRRVMRAGKGKSGLGSSKDGQRGADIVITVPVGTVLKEVWREDPVAEEKAIAKERRIQRKEERKLRAEQAQETALATLKEGHLGGENWEEIAEKARLEQEQKDWEEYEYPHYDKWVFYPGISASQRKSIRLPKLPKRERLFAQPEGPIVLDLMKPTKQPILLAAGGLGGLGNPHFQKWRTEKPMIATKGEAAVSMKLELELKLLADVGLVGLPNAGKSTLLRALTNSRARIGNWAFTTLQPNIGTVILDSYRGRTMPMPRAKPKPEEYTWGVPAEEQEARTRFTIADIPGLIEGAHLDKGLGIAFLRHVERAGVLAFVVDLSAGPAVEALKALWKEVGLYAKMREDEERDREIERKIEWDFNIDTAARATSTWAAEYTQDIDIDPVLHIAGKPWFVIATKGDLPETQENFKNLKYYLNGVTRGEFEHPSGVEGGWIDDVAAIPVSAINGHGMDRIVHWTAGLLDQ
ncbi:obg family GTPase CgtA [Zalerion maritima]|uniref:Obg family GTPase CgtA n=1 Tax=Zalerion maritima TaxID=339359 RepID=A0AAD5RXN3_9PEZI|nr:obg family GTPase CgtA [Zalerion maritima]